MTQRDRRTASPNAIELVHQPADRPAADRYWTRGLVVRHARDQRLRLVDKLADDLGVQHLPVPHTDRPQRAE
jgi:hypothetical protein